MPPIREIYGPRTTRSRPPSVPPPSRQVREPARSIFVPVASAAFSALTRLAPGFKQALFVIHPEGPIVFLVAYDDAGQLRAIDPPAEVVDAAARMVEADRNDGNGPWRKLSARITPKPDGGASFHVDVL